MKPLLPLAASVWHRRWNSCRICALVQVWTLRRKTLDENCDFIKLSGGVSKRKTTVLSVLMSFHREDKKQPKLCGCDRPSADDHQTLTRSCSYLMSSSLKWNSTVTQDSEEFQVRLCRWLWGKMLMSQTEKKNRNKSTTWSLTDNKSTFSDSLCSPSFYKTIWTVCRWRLTAEEDSVTVRWDDPRWRQVSARLFTCVSVDTSNSSTQSQETQCLSQQSHRTVSDTSPTGGKTCSDKFPQTETDDTDRRLTTGPGSRSCSWFWFSFTRRPAMNAFSRASAPDQDSVELRASWSHVEESAFN